MFRNFGISSVCIPAGAMALALFVPAAAAKNKETISYNLGGRHHAGNRGFKVLYAFCSQANCTDGSEFSNVPPNLLLRDDAGNLYGTTASGGSSSTCSDGCGAAFKISPDGAETVIYSFCPQEDCGNSGYGPNSNLISLDGIVYGTTLGGGADNYGTIYQLGSNGSEAVLHSFQGENDGGNPEGNIVTDGIGDIYGTTSDGGAYGKGTVFEYTISTGVFATLHAFGNAGDGSEPTSGVVMDRSGSLYGTTDRGGASTRCSGGCGAVFDVTPNGNESVLYSFCSEANCTDGSAPSGTLAFGRGGKLYGTTVAGGEYDCGTVFRLSGGTETVVYSFCGGQGDDGSMPASGVIADSKGNLYGTTYYGGEGTSGTVFRISRKGSEKILYSFTEPSGELPVGGLLLAGKRLFGTTSVGGANGEGGTIFSMKK